jgi:hypothetical protein
MTISRAVTETFLSERKNDRNKYSNFEILRKRFYGD